MQQPDVLGRRIGAAVIDIAIVVLIVLLVGGIIGNDTSADAPDSARFGSLDRLVIVVLVFAYYFVTEAFWNGQTIGKKVLDIRVERVTGGLAGPGPIFLRTLLRVVDGLLLYLVGLIAVLATGERRQRLGDMAAKTRVVSASTPPARPGAPPPPPPDEDVLAQIMR
jgi:uncharacterized RDD family membrane protein YckC